MNTLQRHPGTVVCHAVNEASRFRLENICVTPFCTYLPYRRAIWRSTQERENGGRHGHTARAGYCRHGEKMKGFDVTTPLLPADNDECDFDGSTSIGVERQTRETRAERDVEESRGRGCYSLHAVIGQGSFGRIHLASWRRFGDTNGVVNSTHNNNRNRNVGSSGGNPTLISLLAGRRQHQQQYSGSVTTPPTGISPQGSSEMAELGASFGLRAYGYVRQRQPSPMRAWNLRIPVSPSTFVKPRVDGAEPAESDRSLSAGEGRRERIGLTEGGWRDSGDGESIRLRAVKSVCKRKITEKGLMHHMETVRNEGRHPVANSDCRLFSQR